MTYKRYNTKLSRFVFTFIVFVTVMFTFTPMTYSITGISVIVDGNKVQFTQEPIVQDGRTLVPLRAIFESLGMKVEWEQSTQSVNAYKDNIIVKLQIDNDIATIENTNSEYITVVLDVKPQIINSRTLVPVRFIGEASGSDVSWDELTQTVNIKSNKDRYFGEEIKTDSFTHLGYISSKTDLFDGFGWMSFNDSSYFLGNFKDGKFDGYGTNAFADGNTYVGYYKEGYPNGLGTMYWANGGIFTGNWISGLPNGQGEQYNSDGSFYTGEFKNGIFHGNGKFTWKDGFFIDEAIFKDGYPVEGTRYNSDGTVFYTGTFINGMPPQ